MRCPGKLMITSSGMSITYTKLICSMLMIFTKNLHSGMHYFISQLIHTRLMSVIVIPGLMLTNIFRALEWYCGFTLAGISEPKLWHYMPDWYPCVPTSLSCTFDMCSCTLMVLSYITNRSLSTSPFPCIQMTSIHNIKDYTISDTSRCS